MDMTDQPRAHSKLNSTRLALQRLERGRDPWALRWQALLAIIDLSILAFFILGPYLRAGPSYLIIDYIVVRELSVRH